MPGGAIRVYPASGAVAMLPLTPANNYNPTILFCGGSDIPERAWGNYSSPNMNTWEYPESMDCQRLTPEPTDGSAPKDDDMLEGRPWASSPLLRHALRDVSRLGSTCIPKTLSYGGPSFDVTVPASSYGGQHDRRARAARVHDARDEHGAAVHAAE